MEDPGDFLNKTESGKVAILYLNHENCWKALRASSATT